MKEFKDFMQLKESGDPKLTKELQKLDAWLHDFYKKKIEYFISMMNKDISHTRYSDAEDWLKLADFYKETTQGNAENAQRILKKDKELQKIIKRYDQNNKFGSLDDYLKQKEKRDILANSEWSGDALAKAKKQGWLK